MMDDIIKKYPQKRAALLGVLYAMQKEYGCINDEVISKTAKLLDLPEAHVAGVVSFYTLFKKPSDKQIIYVCSTLSCALRGSERIHDRLKNKINGNVTLKKTECLACCDKAPVIKINGRCYENVTVESLDRLLKEVS